MRNYIPKKTGRPRAFKTPKEFELRSIPYFDECRDTKRMPTKTGLALFLGVSTDTLLEYSKKEGFSSSVKKAYHAIEEAWTQNLSKAYPVGSIFYLKNSFGWTDKMEQTNTNLNVFFVPKEIAQKHGLILPTATPPKAITTVEAKLIETPAPVETPKSDGVSAAT